MVRRYAAAALVLALVAPFGPSAWAAKKRPTIKPKLEIYDATEGAENDTVPDTVVVYRAPKKKAAAKPVAPVKGTFDAVPAEHAAGVAKRLVLVDRLIREFGRAYDYRIHTVADLETILKDLEIASQTTGDGTPAPPAPAEG